MHQADKLKAHALLNKLSSLIETILTTTVTQSGILKLLGRRDTSFFFPLGALHLLPSVAQSWSCWCSLGYQHEMPNRGYSTRVT